MEKHTHQFAVDAACDCGAMISEVVRKLTSDNAALITALERIEDNVHCWSNQQIAAECRDALAKSRQQDRAPMG